MTEEQPTSLPEAQLNGLDERIAETADSLLGGFPIASAEQHQHLETKLKRLQNVLTLYQLIVSFRTALGKDGKTDSFKKWTPKGLIEQVIQACCNPNQQYKDHGIEYMFYKHGDINGLLVLYLGTRNQTHLFPKLNALPKDMIVALARQSGKEKIPSILLPEWVRAYDKSKDELDHQVALPRLYRYGRKKELSSEPPRNPRKRGRDDTATPQTRSDMQIGSTKETSQKAPDLGGSIEQFMTDLAMNWDWNEDPSLYNPLMNN